MTTDSEPLELSDVQCACCPNMIESIRLELMDTIVCAACAKEGKHQPPIGKGMMIYDHKTGGQMIEMPAEQFAEAKRLTDRKGNMSILRKVSPSKA